MANGFQEPLYYYAAISCFLAKIFSWESGPLHFMCFIVRFSLSVVRCPFVCGFAALSGSTISAVHSSRVSQAFDAGIWTPDFGSKRERWRMETSIRLILVPQSAIRNPQSAR